MKYTAPDQHNVLFNFISTYSPPLGGNIIVDFDPDPEIPEILFEVTSEVMSLIYSQTSPVTIPESLLIVETECTHTVFVTIPEIVSIDVTMESAGGVFSYYVDVPETEVLILVAPCYSPEIPETEIEVYTNAISRDEEIPETCLSLSFGMSLKLIYPEFNHLIYKVQVSA